MLALVILVTVGGSFAALDPNCTMVDATAGTLILAPTATVCADKVSDAVCTQFFTGPAAVMPSTDAAVDRAATCYQDSASVPSPEIKKAAIDMCPKFCGFCCVTPEYNCANSPTPRINCGSITQAMCQSTQWREIIAQDCPSACGFCLLGGCIDAAPDCATQPTICGNTAMTAFVQENCKRTCGLCNSATTAAAGAATTAASGGGSACSDTNANCANWVRNGFCTSTFYTTTQKQQYCGSSCGLCGGK